MPVNTKYDYLFAPKPEEVETRMQVGYQQLIKNLKEAQEKAIANRQQPPGFGVKAASGAMEYDWIISDFTLGNNNERLVTLKRPTGESKTQSVRSFVDCQREMALDFRSETLPKVSAIKAQFAKQGRTFTSDDLKAAARDTYRSHGVDYDLITPIINARTQEELHQDPFPQVNIPLLEPLIQTSGDNEDISRPERIERTR
ncbi:MAG: hypothetical protein V1744_03950 [Candidatus Altiarchaeota archaeon]